MMRVDDLIAELEDVRSLVGNLPVRAGKVGLAMQTGDIRLVLHEYGDKRRDQLVLTTADTGLKDAPLINSVDDLVLHLQRAKKLVGNALIGGQMPQFRLVRITARGVVCNTGKAPSQRALVL